MQQLAAQQRQPTARLSQQRRSNSVAMADAGLDGSEAHLAHLEAQISEMKAQLETTEENNSNDGTGPNTLEWCRLQRSMAPLVEERELILEEKRVEVTVADVKDNFPALFEDLECPVCLETFPPAAAGEITMMPCCGKDICNDCSKQACVEYIYNASVLVKDCPFCRFDLSTARSEEEARQIMVDRAADESGSMKAFANYALGHYYKNRSKMRKAATHFRRSADEGCAEAENRLAELYFRGDGVEQSNEEAHRLALSALKKGVADAPRICVLASPNDAEVVKWMTFVAAQMQSPECQELLGLCYLRGERGLQVSLERARYWFEKSAEQGNANAQYSLGTTILSLAKERYDSHKFAEHNVMPRALYWVRKAAEQGNTTAVEKLPAIELEISSLCAFCNKKAVDCPNHKLLTECKRCKAAFYCGLQCWAKDCKAFHMNDCLPFDK